MLLSENESLISELPSDSNEISVWDTVSFALRFLSHNWLRLLAVTCVPLAVSSTILYLALDGYLSELERFQGSPNPNTAGIALAELAAGAFAALFTFSLVVVSITEILDGRRPRLWRGMLVRRQEWRLYAAYLKFLVAILALFTIVGAVGVAAIQYVPLWFFVLCALVGAFAMYVRTAFLFPPLIMVERGPIVRRAWHISGRQGWRIALIVVLLSLPGAIAESASEYALRLAGMVATFSPDVTSYALGVKEVLPGFLIALTVWSFFSATLLTAGATSIYRALELGRGRSAR